MSDLSKWVNAQLERVTSKSPLPKLFTVPQRQSFTSKQSKQFAWRNSLMLLTLAQHITCKCSSMTPIPLRWAHRKTPPTSTCSVEALHQVDSCNGMLLFDCTHWLVTIHWHHFQIVLCLCLCNYVLFLLQHCVVGSFSQMSHPHCFKSVTAHKQCNNDATLLLL